MKRFLICATIGLLGLAVLAGSSTACPPDPGKLPPGTAILPGPDPGPSHKPRHRPRIKHRKPGSSRALTPILLPRCKRSLKPGFKTAGVPVPEPLPRPGRAHRR
jgi:hypothetical protein